MTRDELEFSISQHLDGTLPEADESALAQRLATDAEARALLAEYRSLDRLLRAAPAPAIDHDAFERRITAAVARQPDPAQSYRLHWVRTAASLALAACVVIAVGVGIRRLQTPSTPGGSVALVPHTQHPREPKQIVVVDNIPRPAPPVATTTAPAASPAITVVVGPSAAPEDRTALARYHEDLISRPSQVIIARSGSKTQDGGFLP